MSFCSVGFSTEDDGVWFDGEQTLKLHHGAILGELIYAGVEKNNNESVDKWFKNMTDLTESHDFEDESRLKEFTECFEKFKSSVTGKEGYLVYWSVEYDTNMAFFEKGNKKLLKAAHKQGFQLPK